jgi:hypothetical protein
MRVTASGLALTSRPGERTLAGSKALKRGLTPTGLRQQTCLWRKGPTPGGPGESGG